MRYEICVQKLYAELKKHCANTQPARHRLPELVRLQASVSISETGAGTGAISASTSTLASIATSTTSCASIAHPQMQMQTQRLSPHHQLAHPVSPNTDLCETLGALQLEQASLQANILSRMACVAGAGAGAIAGADAPPPPVPPHKTHSLSGQLSTLASMLPHASFSVSVPTQSTAGIGAAPGVPSTATAPQPVCPQCQCLNGCQCQSQSQSQCLQSASGSLLTQLSSSQSLSSSLQPQHVSQPPAELKYWLSVALEVRAAKNLPRSFQRGAACTLFVRDSRIKIAKTQYCECTCPTGAGGGTFSALWSLEEFTFDDVPFDVDSFTLCVHHPKGKCEGLWLSRRFAEFAPGRTHYLWLPLLSAKNFLQASAAAAERLSPARQPMHKQSPFTVSSPLVDERAPQINIRLQYMVDIAMPIEEYVGYRDVCAQLVKYFSFLQMLFYYICC